MASQLTATKRIEDLLESAKEESGGLRRVLGPVHLVTLGVGAIIGAGIFVLTGQAAALYAGPAVVLSFILCGIGSGFAGLCYAEFASLIPIAGSAYTYAYATLGEIFAWIIGWALVLEYSFGAATVASGWSGYFMSLLADFNIQVPPQWTAVPGTKLILFQGHWQILGNVLPAIQKAGLNPSALPQATGIFNLVALVAILVITTILVIGVKESANMNAAAVITKVSAVLVFIVLAAIFVIHHPQIAAANWHPFLPKNTGKFGQFGWSGVLRGASVIFFAYIGFDAVSTTAQEARNPQKDMPIGIIGSLVICTFLYIIVAALLSGVVPYTSLNVADPVAVGVRATGVRWGSILVNIGAVAGLGSVMLVMLLGQSRIFWTMSKDGLLPRWAGKVHPRFRTPWISSIVVGIPVAIAAAFLPISQLAELVNIGTLSAFVIVCIGVWVLRRKQPNLERPFRTPWVPVVPILGAVIALGLMAGLPALTWYAFLCWAAFGLILYFSYGRRHSLLRAQARE
ncbi:MAG TPA: amino acid permease [Edaphobacter sp.]|uniref:amino acid permease n=1 Tax=Edaphobacter sp. TaxID=1934404 RepID=UPI002C0DB3CE|nr:amino acid permease [Edaphobacter sp.]HUZ97353.1 amino acid permease [Edaphobacter sp.]